MANKNKKQDLRYKEFARESNLAPIEPPLVDLQGNIYVPLSFDNFTGIPSNYFSAQALKEAESMNIKSPSEASELRTIGYAQIIPEPELVAPPIEFPEQVIEGEVPTRTTQTATTQQVEVRTKQPFGEIPSEPQWHDEEIADLIARLGNLPPSEYKIEPPASDAQLALGAALAGLASIGSQAAQLAWSGFEKGLEKASERKRTEAYYRWLEGVRATTRQIQAIKARIAQLQNIDARQARIWEAKLRALMRQRELMFKWMQKLADLEMKKKIGKSIRGKLKGRGKGKPRYRLIEILSEGKLKTKDLTINGSGLREALIGALQKVLENYKAEGIYDPNELKKRIGRAVFSWFQALDEGGVGRVVDLEREMNKFQEALGAPDNMDLENWLNMYVNSPTIIQEIKQELIKKRQQEVAEFKSNIKNQDIQRLQKYYLREVDKINKIEGDEERIGKIITLTGGSLEGVNKIIEEINKVLEQGNLSEGEKNKLREFLKELEIVKELLQENQ